MHIPWKITTNNLFRSRSRLLLSANHQIKYICSTIMNVQLKLNFHLDFNVDMTIEYAVENGVISPAYVKLNLSITAVLWGEQGVPDPMNTCMHSRAADSLRVMRIFFCILETEIVSWSLCSNCAGFRKIKNEFIGNHCISRSKLCWTSVPTLRFSFQFTVTEIWERRSRSAELNTKFVGVGLGHPVKNRFKCPCLAEARLT